jgi:ubiquinone/menaquinone biosynthesis C-methylase UbiE
MPRDPRRPDRLTVSDSTAVRRSRAFTSESVPENYERLLAAAIFEPWAELLVTRAGIGAGESVLDVASGTGVVARRAALAAGPAGRVLASDLSPAMLARAQAHAAQDRAAPIEFLESAAETLPVAAGTFDVALCQQGLQFFPDKPAALGAVHNALRAGGRLALAVWAAGEPLQPFDGYGETLRDAGVEPPFAGAFEPGSFRLGAAQVQELLEAAGFGSVEVTIERLTIVWADQAMLVEGILGTPFGPLVSALDPERRADVDAELARRLGPQVANEPVRHETVAVIAVATR